MFKKQQVPTSNKKEGGHKERATDQRRPNGASLTSTSHTTHERPDQCIASIKNTAIMTKASTPSSATESHRNGVYNTRVAKNRKRGANAARRTCSVHGRASCARAASPSRSNGAGSGSTCRTCAAGSASSGGASAWPHCCSTCCTHCTSGDARGPPPSRPAPWTAHPGSGGWPLPTASHEALKDSKNRRAGVCQPLSLHYANHFAHQKKKRKIWTPWCEVLKMTSKI